MECPKCGSHKIEYDKYGKPWCKNCGFTFTVEIQDYDKYK
jgi:predicted Zn-ribbon and HTH transcriptional regulator